MPRNTHHIANLNTISDSDPLEGRPPTIDEDLSIFTNTNFYDFDQGRSTNIATTVDELLMQQERQLQFPQKTSKLSDGHYLAHMGSSGTPSFADPGTSSSHGAADPSLSVDYRSLQEFSLAGELFPVMQSSGGLGFRNQLESLRAPQSVSGSTSSRESEMASPEDLARQLVEEDKRKRNTAASARFRIKKKLREQEMERKKRQMQSTIEELEKRVKQLEMENGWLKNLVMERNERNNVFSIEELRTRVLGASKAEQ